MICSDGTNILLLELCVLPPFSFAATIFDDIFPCIAFFSGRWEESLTRDKDGHIFLDYDDELIKIIVNYLREKKIEDPSDPVTGPIIPHDKTKSFQRLIQYFGLTEFLYPSSLHCFIFFKKNNFVEHNGESFVTVTEDETNKIKLLYSGESDGHPHWGAFSTELDPSGDGVFWKVKIEKLPTTKWIFFGITGNLDLPDSFSDDNQAYGWGGDFKYVKGNKSRPCNGWTHFVEGESLYFSFKSNQLRIHRVQSNKASVIDIDDVDTNTTTKLYFLIGFHSRGTTVTLESLNAEDRAIFD